MIQKATLIFKKINPFWKKLFISISFLGVFASFLSHQMFKDKSVLHTVDKEKMDNLSSLQRVKALYENQKIKNDLISDDNTKMLLISEEKSEKKETNQKEEKTNATTEVECDPYDEALHKCKLDSKYQTKIDSIAQNISLNTKQSLSDDLVKDVSSESIDSGSEVIHADFRKSVIKEPLERDATGLSMLIASVGKTEILAGRIVDIGAAEHQIKAGTTVLAVLNEAKTITSSGEQFASASIIGAPFDNQRFPDGVTVLMKLKLNGTQDGIEGSILSCSSRRNTDRTIACSGQLEDISGASALRGEVYSSAGWQIVTTAATTFLSGMSLAKLTTTTTQLGTTVDQTTSNAVYQALSSAITSMGQQIAASFARSGTQISIPGRVVVRILFTKDSVW